MKLINKIKQFLREREHAHWLHGRMLWRHRSGAEFYLEYRCSRCNHYYHWPTPYCPHCGKKMDEVI